MIQFSLNAPDSSRKDANPWQSYSKDNSQNYAEATYSPTERTELGYIYEVLVLSDSKFKGQMYEYIITPSFKWVYMLQQVSFQKKYPEKNCQRFCLGVLIKS